MWILRGAAAGLVLALLASGCAGRGSVPEPVATARPSTTAASPAAPTPIARSFGASGRCGELVGAAMYDEIVTNGAVELGDRYSEGVRTTGGDTLDLRFLDDGGFICVWGGYDAGIADHTYAFSQQTPEQRLADEKWVIEHGAVEIDNTADLVTYSFKEVEGFLGGEDPLRIAFGEGYWVHVTSLQAARLLPLVIANRPST